MMELRTSLRIIVALVLFFSVAGVAQAAEYRIIIGDSTACRNAGASGSDCLIKVTGTTQTASSATTSSTTTTSSSTSSSGSAADCVVTTWNPCSGSGGTTTGTGGVISSNTNSTTTTTTTTTTTPSSSAPPPSSTAVAGTQDFGSGGADATGKTSIIEVNGNITALPFTTVAGPYAGQVSLVETSAATPQDGSGVRAWISQSKGGTPLPGTKCSRNWGFQGSLNWDQTGKSSYSCQIPNANATLYLNLQLCISSRTDRTCSASGATSSTETATLYISGTKGTY